MSKETDPRLQISAVQARYNDPLWFSKMDAWHLFTADEISREIKNFWDSFPSRPNYLVLNAGAGGQGLGICTSFTINLDISERRVSSLSNPLLASIEALPLADCTIDIIVCVGSVINYCDAAAVIVEFSRVLRPGGYLLLDFESSHSAELMMHDSFGQSATIVETFYANQQEIVWAYSIKYIHNLLNAAEFKLERNIPIHILSPWGLLLLRSNRVATFMARLDWIVRGVPFLTRWASNHLFFCSKRI